MRINLLLLSSAFALSCVAQTPSGILSTIVTQDKAVPEVNQAMAGTWMIELRIPGQSPLLNLVTFFPNGTVIATLASGTESSNHGVWLRVGDRKFLQTMFWWGFDEKRVFTTAFKARINAQVSADGEGVKGTAEVVVMDPAGKLLATVPGATYTGVRLRPEIPGDFADFQKQP